MSQTLAKGLMILDFFTRETPTLTIEQIAEKLNMSVISTYRYVKVLCDADLLVMEHGQVQLSAKILRFVDLFWEHNRYVMYVKEPLKMLQQELNETITLCQLEGSDVVCTFRVESSSPLRSSFKIGEKMPIHAGAFARAIAAFLPYRELRMIMNKTDWIPFTEKTIAVPKQFEARLAIIRERGYDISEEEVNPGVTALAVPILVDGKVFGSIGLGIPTVRYNPEQNETYIGKMKQTAEVVRKIIVENHLYTVTE